MNADFMESYRQNYKSGVKDRAGSYMLAEISSREKKSSRSNRSPDKSSGDANRIWSNYVNIKEFSDSKNRELKRLDLDGIDGEIFINAHEMFGDQGHATYGPWRFSKDSAEKHKKSSRKRVKNCRSDSKKTLHATDRADSPSQVFTQKVDREDLIKWWLLNKFESNAEKIIPALTRSRKKLKTAEKRELEEQLLGILETTSKNDLS
jgi:hypothetical protein